MIEAYIRGFSICSREAQFSFLYCLLDAEINLVDHRPSIVAAAAILAAYDDHLSKEMLEMKINVVSSWGSLEKVISHPF